VQTAFRISQVLVLLVVIAGANRMAGQEKPAPLPRALYPLPRYEEDWSFLSDPTKRDDSWDPIKFIPLSEDKSVFLSLGGEIRETTSAFTIPILVLAPMTRTVIFCSAICFTSTSTRDSDFDFSANSTAHSKTDEPEVRAL
jgi:hypothetical protein